MNTDSLKSITDRWRQRLGSVIQGRPQQSFEVAMIDMSSFGIRATVTSAISHAAHGAQRSEVRKWLAQEDLFKYCTPWEINFLNCANPRPSEVNEASWRIERLWMFSWAKGDFDELDHKKRCGAGLSINFPRPGDRCAPFIESIKLRSESELLKEYGQLSYLQELIEVKGEIPEGHDNGVIVERYHALSWLLGISKKWPDSLWS
jgi:hypothetical protein